MKIKQRKLRFNYTLLELISAMAVFLIVCLVVVRFFSGAQKLTTASNGYNEMFADARAFFDIFGNDLQSIVYNNSVSPKGNQPFVLSYYDIKNNLDPFQKFHKNIQNFYDDSMIPVGLENEMALDRVDYVPLLCFISNPSNIPSDSSSPTAEVRYTFIPVGATSSKPAEFNYRDIKTPFGEEPSKFKKGGKILRSLTYADKDKPASPAPPYVKKRHPHDYDIFPIVDEDGNPPQAEGGTDIRIEWVFGDVSSCKYDEVIGHVYRMNITCYKLEADTTSGIYSYKKYNLMKLDGSSFKKAFSDDTSSYIIWPPTSPQITYPSPPAAAANTPVEFAQLGHPLPDMVRVDLYMLSPQDWNLLMNYYDWNKEEFADAVAAKRLLEQKLRHFSRVFHINIKE